VRHRIPTFHAPSRIIHRVPALGNENRAYVMNTVPSAFRPVVRTVVALRPDLTSLDCHEARSGGCATIARLGTREPQHGADVLKLIEREQRTCELIAARRGQIR
jgi:hypothetical protein